MTLLILFQVLIKHVHMSSSKTSVWYRSQIIQYCLALATKSPCFYHDIICDGNNSMGFLMVRSRRRLRDYNIYIHPTQGLNQDIINELLKMLITFHKNKNMSSFY